MHKKEPFLLFQFMFLEGENFFRLGYLNLLSALKKPNNSFHPFFCVLETPIDLCGGEMLLQNFYYLFCHYFSIT